MAEQLEEVDCRTSEGIDAFLRQSHHTEFASQVAEFIRAYLDDSPTIDVRTSGSTGAPKTLTIEKSRMQASAQRTLAFFELSEGTHALLCLPLDYIAGKMMVVRALEGRWRLFLQTDQRAPLRTLPHPIEFTAVVPLQLENSLPLSPHVHTVLVGGAPLSPQLEERLQTETAHIYQSFGMTETFSHIAVRAVNGPNASSAYEALPGVHIKADPEEQLVLEAPGILTGSITTTDQIKWLGEGRFQWLGRTDFVINTGGVKVFPEQVERKLDNLLHTPFFIDWEPDERLGQQVVLIVETETTLSPAALEELVNQLRVNLGKFERPRTLYETQSFTYTETSKLNRPATRDHAFKNGKRTALD